MAIPENTTKREITIGYRNRLTHHIRPSVDYAAFFSALESRAGEETRDMQGKPIRVHTVRTRLPMEYRFDDLHAAFSEYLSAVAAMLQRLSEIEILHR